MFLAKICFIIATLSIIINMKHLFNMLVVLELFSFALMLSLFGVKNYFFILFLLVLSAVLGLIMFFMNLMSFGNDKSTNISF